MSDETQVATCPYRATRAQQSECADGDATDQQGTYWVVLFDKNIEVLRTRTTSGHKGTINIRLHERSSISFSSMPESDLSSPFIMKLDPSLTYQSDITHAEILVQ